MHSSVTASVHVMHHMHKIRLAGVETGQRHLRQLRLACVSQLSLLQDAIKKVRLPDSLEDEASCERLRRSLETGLLEKRLQDALQK